MAVSTLEVLITGDSSRLTGALNQGATSAKTFQKSMGGIGSTARSTLGSIVPIGAAAAGAAVAIFAKRSFDAAVQFDQAFTRIAALSNTSTDAIAGLKEQVLTLASETAQSPQELANALYFLASSGLNAAQQMEALEASAKGSAVGLGETADLARITSQALNVFGDNGLRAADVLDTITAAVREGSAEPDEFADALGRVLPIADKAGISFQQVAASLATMSNAGLDVTEGVTALRGVLQSLVAPGVKTVETLGEIGLTVDDVVNSLQQDGLIATLRMLDKTAQANTDSTGEYNIVMRELIPNVRALTGVFNLTTQEAEKVDKIFQAVTESTGDLDQAFLTTQESASFKLQKAMNDLSITGQELATKTLPVLASVLGQVADNAGDLLVILTGYLGVKFLAAMFRGIAAAQQAQAAAAAEAAIANAANSAALTESTFLMGKAVPATKGLAAAQGTLSASTTKGTATLGPYIAALLTVGTIGKHQFDSILQGADDLANEFNIDEEQAQRLKDAVSSGALSGGTSSWIHKLADPLATTGAKATEAADAYAQLGSELQAAGVPAADVNAAFDANIGLLNANRASIEPFIEAVKQDALETAGLDEATLKYNEDLKAQEQAHQAAKEATDSYAASMATLTGKFDQLQTIGIDTAGFLSDLRTTLEESDDPAKDLGAAFEDLMGEVQDWRDETAASLSDVGGVLGELAGKAHVDIGTVIDSFEEAAKQTREFADDLAVIGSTGGQAGKDLAAALLSMGPSAAGLADTIASSSKEMRDKSVRAFGDILSAGQNGAAQLEEVLVPVLEGIRDVLIKIARKWGINVRLDDNGAVKQIETIQVGLTEMTSKTYDAFVRVHTEPRSPWPDEALKMHLFDPLEKHGAKRIGGVWTIPLEVGVHTAINQAAMAHSAEAVGRNIRDVSGDITRALLRSGVTHGEAEGVISRIQEAGFQSNFIDRSTRDVLHELGKNAARSYRVHLRQLDRLTEIQHRQDVIAAHEAAWQQLQLTGNPRLPGGHTNINPRQHTGPGHERRPPVRLDRTRFDEGLAYQRDYSGFNT